MNPDYCTITGDGPSIIMVHGWGQSRQSLAPLARELSKSFRVINIDLPGHGAAKHEPGPYTFGRYMDQIADVARAECGENSSQAKSGFSLLGWSMGGLIAAIYALRKTAPLPDSLILLAAPARFVAPKSAIGMGQSITSITRLREQLVADHESALRTFIEFFFMSGEVIDPASVAPIRAALAPPDTFPPAREALLATLDQLAESDLTAGQALPEPVRGLIINGTLDRICPKGGQRLWEHVFSGLEQTTLNDCGHAPHLTRLEETSAAIIKFLKGSR
ncbi:MAG: alpha/beta fold hydrolase [Nitrospinota bacterium]|nr:alpha/beta fold hydrolase [Nitrospinota bacterium]